MSTFAPTRIARRHRRKARIRGRVHGTPQKPRLAVFKSNRYMYAQLIDDTRGHTLASANSRDLQVQGSGREQARAVGTKVAEHAKAQKIDQVVFDRGGFKYTGLVKELADAAREGGVQF